MYKKTEDIKEIDVYEKIVIDQDYSTNVEYGMYPTHDENGNSITKKGVTVHFLTDDKTAIRILSTALKGAKLNAIIKDIDGGFIGHDLYTTFFSDNHIECTLIITHVENVKVKFFREFHDNNINPNDEHITVSNAYKQMMRKAFEAYYGMKINDIVNNINL